VACRQLAKVSAEWFNAVPTGTESTIRMLRIIRALPAWAEFAIVVALAFGLFTYASLRGAFHLVPGAHHTNLGFLEIVVYEAAVMAILFPFLRARGWSFTKIGLLPELRDTGVGILLFFASYALWISIWMVVANVSPATARNILNAQEHIGPVPHAITLAIGLVNPLFEEVFVVGYVMTALKRGENSWLALNVSVAIRLAYHLYQGAQGVIAIIPIGLMFGYWYARSGRLWPLIIAHSLIDLIALAAAGR